MIKVPWLDDKKIDFDLVQQILQRSIDINQLTNYGPAVRQLELFFQDKMEIDHDRAVIAICNGAVGLNLLVNAISLVDYSGKKLKMASQAFTFPSAAQGSLRQTQLVDFDQDLQLDVTQVDNEVDGLIVTNLFGNVSNLEQFETWAKDHGKFIIYDNATVGFTNYHGKNANNYGNGSIISLHHTKTIGYGEGGLIVVQKKYEKMIRCLINFGFTVVKGQVKWHELGTNGKMSDIAAAFILAYLKPNIDNIVQHHANLYRSFEQLLTKYKDNKVNLWPYYGATPIVNCFALIFDFDITNDHLQQIALHNITAKKYYTPLIDLPRSSQAFNNILCLPCHLSVTSDTLAQYITVIDELLEQN